MFNKTIFYTSIVSIFVLAGCGGSDNKKTSTASSFSSSIQNSVAQSSVVQSSQAISSISSSSLAASSSLSVASSSISSANISSAVASSSVSSSMNNASSVASSNVSSATSAASSKVSSTASIASSSMSSASSAVSSSSSSVGTVTLNGVAAVGAPIANANVTAKCANNTGFTQAVTTNSQGAFSGTIAANALPCALQVIYGNPSTSLHSYAFAPGIINITPLTDLIIANASTLNPSAWFASNSWQIAENIFTQAQTNFKSSFTSAGYIMPQGNFEPFNTAFVIGDTWDQFLDQIQAAINASSTINSYFDLIALVKDGNLNAIPPKASNGNGSGTGNAASCYNPIQAAQGTTVITTYKTTDGETNSVLNFTSTVEIKGNTTFNGKSAIESTSQTEATGSAPSSSSTKSYFKNDSSAKRFTYYGSIVDTTAPLASNTTLKLTPERIERYDLAANESYTQSYSIETGSVVYGFPVSFINEHTTTITFKGIESVTVPAGTFDACRFDSSDTIVTSGISTSGTSINWVSTQKGVLLRTEAGNDITELVSASINGVNIN